MIHENLKKTLFNPSAFDKDLPSDTLGVAIAMRWLFSNQIRNGFWEI